MVHAVVAGGCVAFVSGCTRLFTATDGQFVTLGLGLLRMSLPELCAGQGSGAVGGTRSVPADTWVLEAVTSPLTPLPLDFRALVPGRAAVLSNGLVLTFLVFRISFRKISPGLNLGLSGMRRSPCLSVTRVWN